ncbi:MAG: UDP-2,3-diacylglucosamine diphosphatase LpxI [Syntrophobacterales bacterium]|nr:UDP-2,3-diacylglucosamine diphosphatase LpxI [Syntrophobacterales bacterium]
MAGKIGLIAGNGQFPFLCARAARSRGLTVIAVAHRQETDPALAELVDELHWVYVGQLGKIIRILKEAGVTQALMAGGVNRGRLFHHFRPDLRALNVLRRAGAGMDDRLLREVAAEMEREGITVCSATLFQEELLAPAGPLTRRRPNRREMTDIAFGYELAKEIGRLDIGQCVVVRHQVVAAVEAAEGTDETIRRGGRLAGPGAVVVKVAKPQQDLRFDQPAVGLTTIATMAEVGAKVLAIEAGTTLIFDREEMLALAEREGIAVFGIAPPPEPSSPAGKDF